MGNGVAGLSPRKSGSFRGDFAEPKRGIIVKRRRRHVAK